MMSRLFRRTGAILLAAVVPLIRWPGHGAAHEPERPKLREIVRAQGYLGSPLAGASALRTVELAILGETHQLHATQWHLYRFEQTQAAVQGDEPARVIVQGTRADLQRLRRARAEQRVTLLAERRTGSTDLYLLAVDLCPPE